MTSSEGNETKGGTHFSQLVVPFVHHVSEVLIVQLVGFVPSVEACGSENGQEAWVVTTLLEEGTTNRQDEVLTLVTCAFYIFHTSVNISNVSR